MFIVLRNIVIKLRKEILSKKRNIFSHTEFTEFQTINSLDFFVVTPILVYFVVSCKIVDQWPK